VGAHRQFVTLARRVAQEGLPVLRFDLRGMGDSSGEHRGYKDSEQDIRAAIAELLRAQPQVREVVLLGECESASGILFYAWRDARVIGSVLINPWVRTDEGRAQVIVRHYYLNRLLSTDFWKHVFAGRFRMRESLSSLAGVVRAYWRGRIDMARHSAKPEVDDLSALPLPVRVAEGLRRFKGRSLLLMSGNDYIAREFDEVTKASRAWEGLLDQARVQRVDIDGADHTFSREVWKSQVADTVARWLVAS
jgi:exosortase A-associated hydrolase 1